jgi:hypothetical protein
MEGTESVTIMILIWTISLTHLAHRSLLHHGSSTCGSLAPSESSWYGTLGTNPRHAVGEGFIIGRTDEEIESLEWVATATADMLGCLIFLSVVL